MCQNYKSETGCTHGKKCFFRHVEAEEKPNKWSKKVGAKDREEGKLGSKHAVKFSRGTWHQIKIRERKGPSRGIMLKFEPHERGLCAPKFEERSHEETLHQERCARRAAWDVAKSIYKLKNSDKVFFYLIEAREMPAVDSGASLHMMSKKE